MGPKSPIGFCSPQIIHLLLYLTTFVQPSFAQLGSHDSCKNEIRYWPNGGKNISYCIDHSFESYDKRLIKYALQVFSFRVGMCITFFDITPADRASKCDPNVKKIYFYNTNSDDVMDSRICYAKVGQEAANGINDTLINLNMRKCGTVGGIQHELLHALGFRHEHSRSDRDNYVEYLDGNRSPHTAPSLYEKCDSSSAKKTSSSFPHYDYDSIMHYSSTQGSNGRDAFVFQPKHTYPGRIGQRNGLSAYDVVRITETYNCTFEPMLQDLTDLTANISGNIKKQYSHASGNFVPKTDMDDNRANYFLNLSHATELTITRCQDGQKFTWKPNEKVIRLTIENVKSFVSKEISYFELPNLLHLHFLGCLGIIFRRNDLAGFDKLRMITTMDSIISEIHYSAFSELPDLQLLALEGGFDGTRTHRQTEQLRLFHCDCSYAWFRKFLALKHYLLDPKLNSQIYIANTIFSASPNSESEPPLDYIYNYGYRKTPYSAPLAKSEPTDSFIYIPVICNRDSTNDYEIDVAKTDAISRSSAERPYAEFACIIKNG